MKNTPKRNPKQPAPPAAKVAVLGFSVEGPAWATVAIVAMIAYAILCLVDAGMLTPHELARYIETQVF